MTRSSARAREKARQFGGALGEDLIRTRCPADGGPESSEVIPDASCGTVLLAALALAGLVAALASTGCGSNGNGGNGGDGEFQRRRAEMVERQIEARGVADPRVLAALREVPRHRFVPEAQRKHAYEDRPLPIGHGQTISQPYIVAVMTEKLALEAEDRVLEIGTGSGYQAAVLSQLVAQVYTIEIVPELAEEARRTRSEMGYANVEVITGDGFRGLPAQAPFDAIIVTAAPERVPEPLLDQLAVGGRLVIPVGGQNQTLRVLERTDQGVVERSLFEVRFVPMTGEAQD